MGTEPTTDELTAGLRSYGRWLEERSHVELAGPGRRDALDQAAIEADQSAKGDATALPLTGRHWDRPWMAPARSRVLAWGGAGLLTIGAVVIGLAVVDRPESDLVTADQAATDESGLAVTTADGDRALLRVEGGEDAQGSEARAVDDAEAPPDPSTPPAAGSTSEPGAGAVESLDDDDSGDDSTDSSGESGQPEADGDEPSWLDSDEPDQGDPPGSDPGDDAAPGSAVVRFMSPTHGEAIERNLANEFRVTDVDGADRYHFVGTQDGVEVFNLSVSEPYFILPSQMVGGPSMEAGLLDLTVTAMADDRALASSSISIRIDAWPDRPIWGG